MIQNQTSASGESVKRIPAYDGIRGLAVIMVLIWACFNNLIVEKNLPLAKFFLYSTNKFWTGVDLFFVLSGFLLGGILLKQKDSKNYFSTFYIRRICRIFPLYYFFLLLYYFLFHSNIRLTMPWVFSNTLPYWSYASFTQNFMMAKYKSIGSHSMEPTWSLATEEQFYLFIPLIIFLLRDKKLLVFIGLASVAALFFRYTAANWYAAFSFLHCRADSFLLGVAAAYLTTNQQTKKILEENKIKFYQVFYALFIVLAANSFKIITNNYYFTYSLQAIFYAQLIMIPAVDTTSKIVSFLKNGLLRFAGKYSFGLYIYHNFILGVVHYLILKQAPQISNWTNLMVTFLAMLVLFIISILSYHLFEKRIIAWGHKFRYN